MIRSMTAYASSEDHGDWGYARWEIRSINHRYLDVSFKLPETLKNIEVSCREATRKWLSRGKIDCVLHYEPGQLGSEKNIHLNVALAEALISVGQQIAAKIPNTPPLSPFDILNWPGVLRVPEANLEGVQATLHTAFEAALKDLILAREREGTILKKLIQQHLAKMQSWIKFLLRKLPEIAEVSRRRLQEKLKDIQLTFDVGRLEQEMVYMLQRMDVSEELGRLQAHITEIERVLEEGGIVGRRLDFIMQELNREANTLSSKSLDNQTTQAAVEIKVLIEQMREQIQNIE